MITLKVPVPVIVIEFVNRLGCLNTNGAEGDDGDVVAIAQLAALAYRNLL